MERNSVKTMLAQIDAEVMDNITTINSLQAKNALLAKAAHELGEYINLTFPGIVVSMQHTSGEAAPRADFEAQLAKAFHSTPTKRKLSAAGRKSISLAQKARWAKTRKEQKVASKKTARRAYNAKHPHWTQLPENAARVRKHLRKIRRAFLNGH